MVSTALAGKYVGLEELADGIWGVYYRHVHLGTLNVRAKHVYELNEYRV
jgi:hypothetical protein